MQFVICNILCYFLSFGSLFASDIWCQLKSRVRTGDTIFIMDKCYYHVRIDYYDSRLRENQTLYDFDFAERSELVDDFALKMLKGENFIFRGSNINSQDIRQIQFYSTPLSISDTLEKANKEVPPSVLFVYTKDNVLESSKYCKNITREIIGEASAKIASQQIDDINTNVIKQPMVFISHSSGDKDFVEALVEMLESLGLDSSNLFCSSVPGFGIPLGKDIFETLKELITNHKLYVIFVQSPRYYESAISLNEMGAAWILQTDSCSILTRDMNYKDMRGVVDGHKIALKVDADDASYKLNNLCDQILGFLNLPQIDTTRWERAKSKFLEDAIA